MSSNDLVDVSRDAGLRYVTDRTPGIRRKRSGRGFTYVGPDGSPIRDPRNLARIRSLAVPPAWTDVWICTVANGHLQGTGRDARGRKQYRYHVRWRAFRDQAKFDRLLDFGRALPRIRSRVENDLRTPDLSREKVLATVIRLLERTLIRVGNEEYARENGSFGLTTLRNGHVEVRGAAIKFEFTGKGGKRYTVGVRDGRLARVVRGCQDLPGQELFQYLGEDGARQAVDSADVNEYIRQAADDVFTAKDFRTWHGTVLAAWALKAAGAFRSEREAKQKVTASVQRVAEVLGNTPAVCRACYIHPKVIEAYLEGETVRPLSSAGTGGGLAGGRHKGLNLEERATLTLLRHRMQSGKR